MLFVLISYVTVFGILVLCDHLIKRQKISPELGRKITHACNATAAAAWPWFTSYKLVILLSLFSGLAAIYVKKQGYFHSLRKVNRISYGEIYFALGIAVTAAFNPPVWAFSIAILHLGFADSMAAIVGKAKGRRHHFTIFDQTKTVEGSTAFFITSVVITGVGLLLVAPAGLENAWLVTLLVPITATMLEMVGVFGVDNILVPVFVASVLAQLA